MKRTLFAIAVVVLLSVMLTGCEALLAALLGETPATPIEQVDGFLTAASADPRDTDVPVVANVDALPYDRGDEWASLLSAQLSSPVRWKHALLALSDAGVTGYSFAGPSPNLLDSKIRPALVGTDLFGMENIISG